MAISIACRVAICPNAQCASMTAVVGVSCTISICASGSICLFWICAAVLQQADHPVRVVAGKVRQDERTRDLGRRLPGRAGCLEEARGDAGECLGREMGHESHLWRRSITRPTHRRRLHETALSIILVAGMTGSAPFSGILPAVANTIMSPTQEPARIYYAIFGRPIPAVVEQRFAAASALLDASIPPVEVEGYRRCDR